MARLGGSPREQPLVRLNVAKVRVPLSAVLAAWAGRRVGAGGWWLTRHPLAVVAAVVVLLAWRAEVMIGPLPVLAVLVAVVLLLAGWWRLHPASFARLVLWRARGTWRSARVYRHLWEPAMLTSALVVRVEAGQYLPKVVSVRSTGCVDVVRVRMLPGQTLTDWAASAPRLAQTFGALDCRVRSVPGRVHDLALWFLRSDPLTTPVEPFEVAGTCEGLDLAALPVAVGEDGRVHRIRLLGAHLLVVGATGSGKGSVIWSLVCALARGSAMGWFRSGRLTPRAGWSSHPEPGCSPGSSTATPARATCTSWTSPTSSKTRCS